MWKNLTELAVAYGHIGFSLVIEGGVGHFDSKLSLAKAVDKEELDEEFGGRLMEMVRARVQTVLGVSGSQGERVQSTD
ncbi:unnamed protein product [Linum trigynum]|uniref:Uncharacterized protein n=1 Tax=Linum trigynum TaxID=586398 RepID=A0AAV2GCS6_9ROSI